MRKVKDHDVARLRVVLVRPEHVEEAERQHRHPVGVLPGQGVPLGGLLRRCVGAERQLGQVLGLGQGRVGAVDRRARRHHQVRGTAVTDRLEHGERAGGVDRVGGDRLGHRPGHRPPRRQVDHGVGLGHQSTGQGLVEDRPFDEVDGEPVEVGGRSGGAVVEDPHGRDPGIGQQGAVGREGLQRQVLVEALDDRLL